MRTLLAASVCLAVPVAGCASGGGSKTPLIMDPSVAQEVRTAASCYAFNRDADRYVFGLQAEMKDYAEAAGFWGSRFEMVEPDTAMRDRLMASARVRMDSDFPRRDVSAPADGNRVEVFNAGYGAVISMCESERSKLEPENG